MPHNTVALDILQSKNSVTFVFMFIFLLLKVTSVSLSCSLFFPELSQLFLSPHPLFQLFLLESWSPISSLCLHLLLLNLCPSIVDLSFAKLLPSFSYFAILFETYATLLGDSIPPAF